MKRFGKKSGFVDKQSTDGPKERPTSQRTDRPTNEPTKQRTTWWSWSKLVANISTTCKGASYISCAQGRQKRCEGCQETEAIFGDRFWLQVGILCKFVGKSTNIITLCNRPTYCVHLGQGHNMWRVNPCERYWLTTDQLSAHKTPGIAFQCWTHQLVQLNLECLLYCAPFMQESFFLQYIFV